MIVILNLKILLLVTAWINVQLVIGETNIIWPAFHDVLMDNMDIKVQLRELVIIQQFYQDMHHLYLVILSQLNMWLFVQLVLSFISEIVSYINVLHYVKIIQQQIIMEIQLQENANQYALTLLFILQILQHGDVN